MAREANGRGVRAMEISPAYVDVGVERWQITTGREAVLDGDWRSFAEVKKERLAGIAGNEPDAGDTRDGSGVADDTQATEEPRRGRKAA